MGRRVVGFFVAVVATAGIVPAAVAYGAPAAAKTPDPCALITDAVAGAAPTPYTVGETTPNEGLKGNCAYSLSSADQTDEPLNLFVESSSDYKLNKALTKKVKATKGLGSTGFTGVDGAGHPVLDFKTKTVSVRLTGDFDSATLLAFAKGISKKLK